MPGLQPKLRLPTAGSVRRGCNDGCENANQPPRQYLNQVRKDSTVVNVFLINGWLRGVGRRRFTIVWSPESSICCKHAVSTVTPTESVKPLDAAADAALNRLRRITLEQCFCETSRCAGLGSHSLYIGARAIVTPPSLLHTMQRCLFGVDEFHGNCPGKQQRRSQVVRHWAPSSAKVVEFVRTTTTDAQTSI